MCIFRKRKKIELDESDRQRFLIILNDLEDVLNKVDLRSHAKIVNHIAMLLCKHKDEDFVKHLNEKDMWGGSGAVWEVYIDNKSRAKEFEKKMIELIDFMEETKVLGKGVKPIRKIFLQNAID
ncbi:hypothetical protein [Sphingobacterium sp. LRF_L2]|uniref:hypothetical protein n=1 Tax=Sphingobacterium sp. LRF_L2 TaxID=3369421 RepID=UPI003F5EEF16